MRDQVVRRSEAGPPSRHLGAHPDPASTNDVAREYLADPLTRARGAPGTPRTACVSDRAPSRRRYIQRGRTGSQSAVGHWLEQEQPEQVSKLLIQFLQDVSAPGHKR